MDSFTCYGKNNLIKVYSLCYESNPCQHKVEFNGSYKGLMQGDKIYKLFVENNIEVPKHFKVYRDY